MSDAQQPTEEPVLLEYNIAGRSVELYVTSTDAAAEGAYIFQEVVLNDEYFKHGIELLPGAIVIDIGAHIGCFGIKALTLVPQGVITYIGVEPCPATFKTLQCNLLGPAGDGLADSFFHYNHEYGGLLRNMAAAAAAAGTGGSSQCYPGSVTLINKAISNQPGSLDMTYYPHMPSNSTFNPAEKQQLQSAITPPCYFEEAYNVTVPVITLDQLLHEAAIPEDHVIDLLKIDVEGHEMQVLQGISHEVWNRIQQIVVEVHDVFRGPTLGNSYNDTEAATAAATIEVSAACPASITVATECGQMPRKDGRVLRIVEMLRSRGFAVVVDCPMDIPTNFTLYAHRSGRDYDSERI